MFPGPTAADVLSTLVQRCAPDVVRYTQHSLAFSARTFVSQDDVMEVFSPPRLTKWAADFGFVDGGAYDLTTGWDARRSEDVDQLFRDLEAKNPFIVSCTPPRGKLSPPHVLTPEDSGRAQRNSSRRFGRPSRASFCAWRLQSGRSCVGSISCSNNLAGVQHGACERWSTF